MVTDELLRSKTGPTAKYDPKSLFERFIGPASKKGVIDLLKKTAVGVATGAVRLLLTGEGTIAVKVGSDYANVGVSFSRTADGTWSISAAGQVGGPVGFTGGFAAAQGKYQYTHNPDGSSKSAFSGSTSEGQIVGPGGVASRQSASSTTTTDKAGHESNKTTTSHQTVGAEPGLPGRPTGFSDTSQTSTTTAPGKDPTTTTSSGGGAKVFGEPWAPTL